MSDKPRRRPDTLLVHAARDTALSAGLVNPPVFRGSTVLFPDVASYERREPDDYKVDALRHPRHADHLRASSEAVAELEGGHAAVALPSGLAAITAALRRVREGRRPYPRSSTRSTARRGRSASGG